MQVLIFPLVSLRRVEIGSKHLVLPWLRHRGVLWQSAERSESKMITSFSKSVISSLRSATRFTRYLQIYVTRKNYKGKRCYYITNSYGLGVEKFDWLTASLQIPYSPVNPVRGTGCPTFIFVDVVY